MQYRKLSAAAESFFYAFGHGFLRLVKPLVKSWT